MNDIKSVLLSEYESIKDKIKARLMEFDSIGKNGSDSDIFYELVFCILTSQSKPEICWEAVKRLKTAVLFEDRIVSSEEILDLLYGVRFKYKKSVFVLEAKHWAKSLPKGLKHHLSEFDRNQNILEARSWVMNRVKGIGIKESSHFLRNIGLGGELAILDRHVLRFLLSATVINEIPSSLSHNKYLAIEKQMVEFAKSTGIDMSVLDFVLFYRATGKIFK